MRLFALACAAAALAGCLGAESASGPAAAQTDKAGANALQEQPAHHPGVPSGCTLEWSGADRDSVLNCPDVRPPKLH